MAAANFLSQTVLLIFVFFAQILCRKSGPCFIERIFSRDREDQKKGRSKGQKKGRKGAVAKCIGHTISCTDIAVIRTGYRISRLFCDNPISYLSNALPHLPTDSAQGGYPSAISSRPSWLCSPGIAKRSSGRSLRCPKQRNRKASGRSRTGRSFSRSDSRSAPRNRAGSLAAQSSADR